MFMIPYCSFPSSKLEKNGKFQRLSGRTIIFPDGDLHIFSTFFAIFLKAFFL